MDEIIFSIDGSMLTFEGKEVGGMLIAPLGNNYISIETVNPSIAHDPNKELFWHFTKLKKK